MSFNGIMCIIKDLYRIFCGESNTKKLDKIQERALRFIYNDSDSSYENLLEKSVTFTEIKEITFHGYRSF